MDGIGFSKARALLFFVILVCIFYSVLDGWKKGLAPVVLLDVLARQSIRGGTSLAALFNDAMLYGGRDCI